MTVSNTSSDVGVSFRDTLECNRDLDSPEEVNKVQGVCGYVPKPGQGMIDVYDGLRPYKGLAVSKELY
jgi:hypothetical protein